MNNKDTEIKLWITFCFSTAFPCATVSCFGLHIHFNYCCYQVIDHISVSVQPYTFVRICASSIIMSLPTSSWSGSPKSENRNGFTRSAESVPVFILCRSVTFSAHAQRGLRYLVRVSVCPFLFSATRHNRIAKSLRQRVRRYICLILKLTIFVKALHSKVMAWKPSE